MPGPRPTLADLPTRYLCSVIGTCLGTEALRKLMARHTDIDRTRSSDLEVHHAAVEHAAQGGAVTKALHKLLAEQHAPAVKRLADVDDVADLEARWADALQRGEVPGAYWALLMHPRATVALRERAFGDVHMLSHRVGSANRADLRRLAALEEENIALTERLERQRAQALEAGVEHERTVRDLTQQLISASARRRVEDLTASAEWALQRDAMVQQTALHAERRDHAERALFAARAEIDELTQRLQRAMAAVDALNGELQAVEQACAEDPSDEGAAFAQALRGQRVLYVGGRPSSNAALRALARRVGGQLAMHDGGIEDRKGLLTAAVQAADLVVFPVDCVDHDSVARLKRLCGRVGVPFRPLRSASVSAFVAAILAPVPHSTTSSRFCLRHG